MKIFVFENYILSTSYFWF